MGSGEHKDMADRRQRRVGECLHLSLYLSHTLSISLSFVNPQKTKDMSGYITVFERDFAMHVWLYILGNKYVRACVRVLVYIIRCYESELFSFF